MKHITVLQKEAVAMLSLQLDSVVVDATYGAGGHAKLICAELGREGTYIGIDADKKALEESLLPELENGPAIHLVNDNFANLDEILSSLHIKAGDRILADLGWRTDQFTDGGKGFSFSSDEPLLMTYGDPQQYVFTAYDIVNSWDEENIADVLYGYAEERHSRRIAKAIVDARKITEIKTAAQLSKIIEQSVPGFYRKGKINPATKTFQAMRIAVNDELGKLEQFITSALNSLRPNGVLAIISFHSLEDRIVKLRFRDYGKTDEFELLTKKPIVASREELLQNPRARSAKLRVIKKIINSSNYENQCNQTE
jgi:16S rRNA (cytosine1402-N4)-methyltransferase